jgi:hypothetical protein
LSQWRRDTTPAFEHSRIKDWILPKKKKEKKKKGVETRVNTKMKSS